MPLECFNICFLLLGHLPTTGSLASFSVFFFTGFCSKLNSLLGTDILKEKRIHIEGCHCPNFQAVIDLYLSAYVHFTAHSKNVNRKSFFRHCLYDDSATWIVSKLSLSKLRIIQIMSYFFHHCHGLKNNYDEPANTVTFPLGFREIWVVTWPYARPYHRQTNVKWVFFYFVWSLDADRRLLRSSWPPRKDNNKAQSFFSDLLLMSTLTSITGKELERKIKKNKGD